MVLSTGGMLSNLLYCPDFVPQALQKCQWIFVCLFLVSVLFVQNLPQLCMHTVISVIYSFIVILFLEEQVCPSVGIAALQQMIGPRPQHISLMHSSPGQPRPRG